MCRAWQLYGHIGRHLTVLTVDRMNVWQAERDNSETENTREWMSGCVRVQASCVLSYVHLPLSVRELRAAVIGVSSTLDWFENIDKMSPVWKLPIFKPSSRNFRETPVPSKSEREFVATKGSEKSRQAKWHLAKGCLLALWNPLFFIFPFSIFCPFLADFVSLLVSFSICQPLSSTSSSLFLFALRLSLYSVRLWWDALAVNLSHSSLSKEWPWCSSHTVWVCCFVSVYDSLHIPVCVCVSVSL